MRSARRRTCAVAALLAGPVLAAGTGSAAASPDGGRGPLPAPDTTPDPGRVIEEARDRQRAFERGRRFRLPYGGGVGPDRCDEVVGRYCLWHEDGRDDGGEPPEEPESVRRDRARLLRRLGRAVEAVPGSRWLVGQRVRYLVEAGRHAEALEAAARCGADAWWCRALEGRVLHEKERFLDAERAFRSALDAMSEERRRRWSDVAELLEGDAADRWDDLSPRGRRRLERRMWRLADPLYLVPGNDRWTEHVSRLVAARLRRDAATPFGRYWTDGLEELTLRYGLPVDYRREAPSPSDLDPDPAVLGRHPPDALSFLPPAEALLRPARAGEEVWRLDASRPHASYAPPYADTVRRVRHRLAVFGRGDTSVVVAAFRASAEREDAGPASLLRLVPVASLDSAAVAGRAREVRGKGASAGALALRVPSRPHLLSLELLHRERKIAERARYAVRLPRRPEGVPGLSDLLVLSPGDAVPATLASALPRVRGPGPVPPGTRLGLYWEIYGPRLLLDGVEVSVALTETGGGLVEQLAGVVGLGDREGVALGWRDAAGRPGRVHPRGVRLRLPDDLPEGDYRLELSVRVPGYDPMTAARRLEVEAGDEP